MLAVACEGPTRDLANNAPKPSIQVIHFEDAFFGIDSLRFKEDLAKLVQQYPSFAADYFDRILMQSPVKEPQQIRAFYKAYWPIYKDVKKFLVQFGFDYAIRQYVPQLKKNQQVVSYESWAKIALCDFQDLNGIGINEVKRAFQEHLKTRSKRKDI